MPQDTTPSQDARDTAMLRAASPARRVAVADALSRPVRALALAGIRRQHPLASEAEVRVRLVARIYGREYATRLFGEIPVDAP